MSQERLDGYGPHMPMLPDQPDLLQYHRFPTAPMRTHTKTKDRDRAGLHGCIPCILSRSHFTPIEASPFIASFSNLALRPHCECGGHRAIKDRMRAWRHHGERTARVHDKKPPESQSVDWVEGTLNSSSRHFACSQQVRQRFERSRLSTA